MQHRAIPLEGTRFDGRAFDRVETICRQLLTKPLSRDYSMTGTTALRLIKGKVVQQPYKPPLVNILPQSFCQTTHQRGNDHDMSILASVPNKLDRIFT